MPHDQLTTSISLTWPLSWASPLITPDLAPLTDRNMSPSPFEPATKFCTTMTILESPRAAAGRARAGACVNRPRLPIPLTFLVLLDVVLEENSGVERAVFLLRLVLEDDLRELHRDALHRMLAAAGGLHAGDQDVVHLDDQVFLLPLTRLARDQCGFLDVLIGSALGHQHRRSLVERVHDVDIAEVRLAGAATAAVTHRACLRHAEGP